MRMRMSQMSQDVPSRKIVSVEIPQNPPFCTMAAESSHFDKLSAGNRIGNRGSALRDSKCLTLSHRGAREKWAKPSLCSAGGVFAGVARRVGHARGQLVFL